MLRAQRSGPAGAGTPTGPDDKTGNRLDTNTKPVAFVHSTTHTPGFVNQFGNESTDTRPPSLASRATGGILFAAFLLGIGTALWLLGCLGIWFLTRHPAVILVGLLVVVGAGIVALSRPEGRF